MRLGETSHTEKKKGDKISIFKKFLFAGKQVATIKFLIKNVYFNYREKNCFNKDFQIQNLSTIFELRK